MQIQEEGNVLHQRQAQHQAPELGDFWMTTCDKLNMLHAFHSECGPFLWPFFSLLAIIHFLLSLLLSMIKIA